MTMKPTIDPMKNGPYRVTNCETLKGLMDGKVYESAGTIALCRCGGSANKPYCDGTHGRIGFTDEKGADRLADKREDYDGDGITIHDNRGICAHAATCTDGLGSVFRFGQEPWIDPKGADAEKIIETVKQCPSGALGYSVDGVEQRDGESDPMILVVPNGPYAVRGGAELEQTAWGEGASRERLTLCRCGQSTNKPFCNGAHWNHHFDEHAPQQDSQA